MNFNDFIFRPDVATITINGNQVSAYKTNMKDLVKERGIQLVCKENSSIRSHYLVLQYYDYEDDYIDESKDPRFLILCTLFKLSNDDNLAKFKAKCCLLSYEDLTNNEVTKRNSIYAGIKKERKIKIEPRDVNDTELEILKQFISLCPSHSQMNEANLLTVIKYIYCNMNENKSICEVIEDCLQQPVAYNIMMDDIRRKRINRILGKHVYELPINKNIANTIVKFLR